MLFDPKRLIQVGVMVPDMAEARDYYRSLGLPFEDGGPIHFRGVYHGEEKEGIHNLNIAMGMLGDGGVEFEIIEPIDGKCQHTDWFYEHGKGLDHLCFEVDDVKAAMKEAEEMGIEIADYVIDEVIDQGERILVLSLAQLHTYDEIGFNIELIKLDYYPKKK